MDKAQLRENRRIWETIAASFNRTRSKPWTSVVDFLQALPAHTRILDAGCGNGRHAKVAIEKGHRVIGLDVSHQLLLHAGRNAGTPVAWVEGAVERLPFKDGRFDVVLGLAVLHHIRGRRARIEVLHEFVRMLKPGGRALLSVWSRDQPRFGPGKEPHPPQDERTVEPGDAWVRWTQHGHDEPRYVHLFGWADWNRELDAAHVPVERVWPESIMTTDEPDNFFALLRRREMRR